MGVGGFAAMRALSTRNDEPERASRPLDQDRDGFVIGEGAGILMLEELEFARQRGAPILAEIIGYGMSGDAFHITQPAENGDGAFRAMQDTLRDAKASLPSRCSYINAHGTSTPYRRQAGNPRHQEGFRRPRLQNSGELHQVDDRPFAGRGRRTGSGHHPARAARPDSASHHQSGESRPGLRPGLRPQHARKAEVEYAMSNSFGFGGTNAALLFRRWSE